MIKNHTVYSKETVKEVLVYHFDIQKYMFYFLYALFPLIIAIEIIKSFFSSDYDFEVMLVVSGMAILFHAARLLTIKLMQEKYAKKINLQVDYQFDESSFDVTSENEFIQSKEHILYSSITRMRDTKHYLVLYVSPFDCYIIDRQGFEYLNDLEQLMILLHGQGLI